MLETGKTGLKDSSTQQRESLRERRAYINQHLLHTNPPCSLNQRGGLKIKQQGSSTCPWTEFSLVNSPQHKASSGSWLKRSRSLRLTSLLPASHWSILCRQREPEPLRSADSSTVHDMMEVLPPLLHPVALLHSSRIQQQVLAPPLYFCHDYSLTGQAGPDLPSTHRLDPTNIPLLKRKWEEAATWSFVLESVMDWLISFPSANMIPKKYPKQSKDGFMFTNKNEKWQKHVL